MEPSDVGPIAGGNIPATEADRAQVASLLRAAASEGRLTPAELDTRLAQVAAADTFDDLIPLTRDLVNAQPSPRVWQGSALAVPAGAPSEQTIGLGVFSGGVVTPTSAIAPSYTTVAVFGGVKLDLTRAPFVNNVCEVQVLCLFGGVDVFVPPGVAVQNRTLAIFGGAEVGRLHDTAYNAPTVIVRGICAFGGVNVKHPKGMRP